MTTPINELIALMEPEAAQASVDTLHNHGLDRLAAVSSAISLRRIADAMTDGKLHINITVPEETKNDLQHLAWECGRNLQSGTRTDR